MDFSLIGLLIFYKLCADLLIVRSRYSIEARHPLEVLITQAEQEFQEKLNHQSKYFPLAVQEYQR